MDEEEWMGSLPASIYECLTVQRPDPLEDRRAEVSKRIKNFSITAESIDDPVAMERLGKLDTENQAAVSLRELDEVDNKVTQVSISRLL